MTPKRILIIGGTGVFGKRLVRHLANLENIALFVSSRSGAKAEQFVATLGSKNAQGVALEHGKNLDEHLAKINPFAVIDCSGPFQTSNYDTAQSVIKSGAHFIDLADARDYLAGFSKALNALAMSHGVSAMAGASSTPTLSSSVVDHLGHDWQRIDTIDICITPGGKSEVGQSVIAAILSYVGEPITHWKNGRLAETTGWSGAKTVRLAQLGKRRVAAVETYDAEYLGPRHSVRSRISFSAGLESSVEQRGLELIASLRKRRLFPDPRKLIPLLLKARTITRIPTSDQGGMMVEMRGLDALGVAVQSRWSLIARNDYGPNIPILPAAAALQALMNGSVPAGANLACQHLQLDDILAQMAPYNIETETEVRNANESGFERYFGEEAYAQLAPSVQHFHRQSAPPVWEGMAEVTCGTSLGAKILSRLFGFPKAGKDVALTVCVDRDIDTSLAQSERWTRLFSDTSMSSVLRLQINGLMSEAFAPFTFVMALKETNGAIEWPVTGWRLGPIPLPHFVAPHSVSREYQDEEGRFRFDVKLSAPIVGLLAHYRGWLTPKEP